MSSDLPWNFHPAESRASFEVTPSGTVNRVTALVRRIFNLALRWETFDGRNPAKHAEIRREQHRERFLSESELRALFLALDEEPNQVAAGVLALLAATGARKGEALAAKWEDIDLDRRLWTVPLSKSGRRRHIPLSGLAPDLRIHDLRHTFASRVLAGGASIHQIGQILGHSQIQMTMRYAHQEKNQLVEVANLIQHAG